MPARRTPVFPRAVVHGGPFSFSDGAVPVAAGTTAADGSPAFATAGAASQGGHGAAFKMVRKPRLPRWLLLTSAVIVCLIVLVAMPGRKSQEPARFLTGVVTRGPLTEAIRATGTVQPVAEVQVGAQVSGRIVSVRVDYNSRVKAGTLLGEIDPVPYRAQVAQVRASLLSARAQLAQNRANAVLAEQNLARQRRLRDDGANAPAELDSATAAAAAAAAAVQVAAATVSQVQAALTVAQANLNYTRILAPIDGTVATRSVDPGQTVAASFQTPTLFVIANDLSRMRVVANVDETNVGKLSEGLVAAARVDAFPSDTFWGRLTQLRISPSTTNGVVTYQAVVDIANPQNRLRPGMTTTITVITAQRADVLRVANAALRYQPGAQAPRGRTRSSGSPLPALASHDDDAEARAPRGAIYIAQGAGRGRRVTVRVGISDGRQTEIEGPGIAAGQEVILDETAAATKPRGPAGPRMF